MSRVFFEQLELPTPKYHLTLKGNSQIQQIAEILPAFEAIVKMEKPNNVVVFGDVNSTLACALVASKLNIRLAHVEAGLRCGDNSMPEEINRKLTDAIANDLFVTEVSGIQNLRKDGISEERIHFVGNCMIDTLLQFKSQGTAIKVTEKLGLIASKYALVTFHRPSNVDQYSGLQKLVQLLLSLSQRLQVVFPVHPRTQKQLEQFKLLQFLHGNPDIFLTEPMGYLEFLDLMANAAMVITDSGGVQEETTFLKVPCITFRTTTERPATIEYGTNVLAEDLEIETVVRLVDTVLNGHWKIGQIPPLWDGAAGMRIVDILTR